MKRQSVPAATRNNTQGLIRTDKTLGNFTYRPVPTYRDDDVSIGRTGNLGGMAGAFGEYGLIREVVSRDSL